MKLRSSEHILLAPWPLVILGSKKRELNDATNSFLLAFCNGNHCVSSTYFTDQLW